MVEVQPTITLRTIAERFDLTPERVRQIVIRGRRLGWLRVQKASKGRAKSRLRRCLVPGCDRLRLPSTMHCAAHGPQEYTCPACRTKFIRKASDVRLGQGPGGRVYGPFCSHSCIGRWMAPRFGWGTAYQRKKGIPRSKVGPSRCRHVFVLLDERTGMLGCTKGCGYRWRLGVRQAGPEIACTRCGNGPTGLLHLPPIDHLYQPPRKTERRPV